MENAQNFCPSCGQSTSADTIFCSHCGRQLKEAPLSTSALTQTWIYLLSILLPPLGLWPGIKYVRHGDPKTRQIGWIAIALTIFSSIVTIWATFAFLNAYLNALNGSLNGIGY